MSGVRTLSDAQHAALRTQIRARLRETGRTHADVAEAIGVSLNHLREELGGNRRPGILFKLADLLGVSTSGTPSAGPYTVVDRVWIHDANGNALAACVNYSQPGGRLPTAANARLLAASWELLEAARRLANHFGAPDAYKAPCCHVELDRLDAAIAKATQS